MTTATGTPSKSTTNISPRRDLPGATRASKIDLSSTPDHASSAKLWEAHDRLWRGENRESIAAYNQHIQARCLLRWQLERLMCLLAGPTVGSVRK